MRLGWVSNSHKPMICSQMCSGLNYAAWLAIVSRIILKCRPHPVPLAPFEINDPSIVNLNRVLIVTDVKKNARNFLKSDCFYYYTPLLLLSYPPPPPHFLSPATQKVVVYYVLPSEPFECPFISASIPHSNLSSFWHFLQTLHGHWYQGGMVWDCKCAKFVDIHQSYS